MPNITGLSIKEAKNTLKGIGIQIDLRENEVNEETIIKEQFPKEGIKINKGSSIYVEY